MPAKTIKTLSPGKPVGWVFDPSLQGALEIYYKYDIILIYKLI